MKRLILLTLILLPAAPPYADTLYVAVASNFSAAMGQIVQRFERSSGHVVKVSSGATGKHYAQIHQGAPFDVFFAADSRRPQLLEQQGLANGRTTYALGQLLLWSPDPELVDGTARVLGTERYQYLAIANPKLAPYGLAAQQVLNRLGLWSGLRSRMVRGENIGQAYQFVSSGNAQLGFVAAAQVLRADRKPGGSWWVVPSSWHSPIRQQVVALNDKEITRQFLAFVDSAEIRQLIRQFGYQTP